MKILLLNIANNITDFKTVASGETIYLKQMLEKSEGVVVTIASNKKGEYAVPFEEIDDINSFDKVVVLPAAINFFGGVESPTILKNYMLLAKYTGTVNILQTDARLPFKQLWASIAKRGWGYSKEDVWVNAPIKVVAQSRNLDEVKSQYNVKEIEFENITFEHFPIERYAGIVALDTPQKIVEEKEHDLVYYGSFRAGNRAEKMDRFLCGSIAEYLDVHTFGTLKLKQLEKISKGPYPSIGKKIKMDNIVAEVSKSVSTLIIGEKFYNDAMFTVRVWETLSSQAVVLIDEDFDSSHLLFPAEDWRYIKNENQLINIVTMLKENKEVAKKAVDSQYTRLRELIHPEEWLKQFKEVLI